MEISNQADVFKRTRKILSQFLKIGEEEIKPDSLLGDDLGVDSVDFWEIVVRLEKEFGIEVPDDKRPDVKTVQDVIETIEKLTNISKS